MVKIANGAERECRESSPLCQGWIFCQVQGQSVPHLSLPHLISVHSSLPPSGPWLFFSLFLASFYFIFSVFFAFLSLTLSFCSVALCFCGRVPLQEVFFFCVAYAKMKFPYNNHLYHLPFPSPQVTSSNVSVLNMRRCQIEK